jgi:NCAIR mutase (PurE)-related protein
MATDQTDATMRHPADVNLDLARAERIGFGEAVLCDSKTADQIERVLEHAAHAAASLLLTRLSPGKLMRLGGELLERLDYEEISATAYFGTPLATLRPAGEVCVVSAGTSDTRVAREAVRVLAWGGVPALEIYDVGVAGLWRLLERLDEIAAHRVVIAVAGMDAALPTVLAGLVPGLIVAVPTSTGYGIAEGGITGLRALLVSCGPGIVVVNIDNGYGAATAALRALGIGLPAPGASAVAAAVGGAVS